VVAAAAALTLVLIVTVAYPLVGRRLIRTRVVAALEARFGQASIGGIDVSLGRAVLTDVVIGEPGADVEITIDRVVIDVSTWRSLIGAVDVERVAARGVAVRVDVGALGRGGVGAGARRRGAGHRRLPAADRIDVVDLAVEMRGLTLPGGGSGRARLDLPALRRGGDRTWRWSGGALTAGRVTLADVAGTVGRAADGRIALDVGARPTVPGVAADPRAWRLTGALDGGGRGALTVTSPGDAGAPAELRLTLAGDDVDFDGDVALPALTLDHRALADRPVPTAPIALRTRGGYHRARRELELPVLTATSRGVTVELAGTFALAGGRDRDGGARARPRFDARVLVPPTPCDRVLAALPAAMTPALAGYRLGGTFAVELHAAIDWARLSAIEIDGAGGLAGCEVLAAPPVSPATVTSSFTVRREVGPGAWTTLTVGPRNPDYVRLDAIAPVAVASLLATEDPNFYVHDGLDARGLRRALIANLEAGSFRIGSSTITMQLAKNLFLPGDKTVARKLQEVVLAWHLEQAVRKPKLLELYLNVIEFGPGVFGIGPAARHYFDKQALDLGPREAAFFSAIVPRPTWSYEGFCTRVLDPLTRDKIRRALSLLVNAGTITSDEWREASAARLELRATGEPLAACLARRDQALAVLRRRESPAP